MEKTPDYVKGKSRDPRNPPDPGEAETEAQNKAAGKRKRDDKD